MVTHAYNSSSLKLRQKCFEFEVNLSCIVRPYVNNNSNKLYYQVSH